MPLSPATLAGASATAAAAAVVFFRREQTRRATERFAAAALETLLNAIDANDPETTRLGAYKFAIPQNDEEARSVRFDVGRRAVSPVEVSAEILKSLNNPVMSFPLNEIPGGKNDQRILQETVFEARLHAITREK